VSGRSAHGVTVTGDAVPVTEGVVTATVMVRAGIGRSVALVWVLFRVMRVTGGLEKLSDGFQQITYFFFDSPTSIGFY
jgi:hypothetical protein